MLLQYEGPQPPTQGRVFRIPSWGSSTNSSQTSSQSIRSRASSIHHPQDQDVEAGGLPSSTRLVNATDAEIEQVQARTSDPEKGNVTQYVNGLPQRHVETPKLSVYFAFGLLIGITVLTVRFTLRLYPFFLIRLELIK